MCMSHTTHTNTHTLLLSLIELVSVPSDPSLYLFIVPQARKNELAVEDMDGGTFTISNGGVFGSMFGTPIINPPQSAILGMHGIFDRPVAIGGKVSVGRLRLIPLLTASRLMLKGRISDFRTYKNTFVALSDYLATIRWHC